MKFLDKMVLFIFSVMMLIISILTLSVIFNWVDVVTVYVIMNSALKSTTICNILIGVNILFILLAIKGIFFESKDEGKESYKGGILLENDDGKLLITKETLTSIVNSVVSGFESVKSQQSKVYLDENNDLSIVLTIEVSNNAIIKELSNNIQIRIKDAIKKSLDVEVKSLDIRVKDVVKQEPGKEI